MLEIYIKDDAEIGNSLQETVQETVRLVFNETVAEHVIARASASVVISSDEEIRRMNSEWRGVDAATDVLSFPFFDDASEASGYIGDVIISAQRAREQAKSYGHSFDREIAFLALHGFLHLLGMDHVNDEDEAAMIKKQREILDKLGILR